MKLIEGARAAVRFLSASPPAPNPIEMMWSKIKAWPRPAEPRDATQLQRAIAQALQSVTATDAAHWFAACGCGVT